MISALPANFLGAVFIVLHIPPAQPSSMAWLLNNASEMICQQATSGERTQAGHVYIALPDFHLTLEDGVTVLTRTAQVNYFRTSIDEAMYPGMPRNAMRAAEVDGVQIRSY